MTELKLQDLLRFSDEEQENVRVRFSMPNGIENPKYVYLKNPDEFNTKWFLHSGKKYNNFKEGSIAISLLMLRKDIWLLTSIKKILKVTPPNEGEVWNCNCYQTEELEKYKNLFGRTYISFHKNRQSGKYKYNTIKERLLISKIESEEYGENSFNGYKFELNFRQLESIITCGKQDWINALSHIQAVYIISDNSNGKQYIGSATSSDEFLLSRWKSYIKNGHGNDVGLEELIKEKGIEYIKDNFSYRILDYFSENYPSSKVLDCENYWKDVLKTRMFGYNKN